MPQNGAGTEHRNRSVLQHAGALSKSPKLHFSVCLIVCVCYTDEPNIFALLCPCQDTRAILVNNKLNVPLQHYLSAKVNEKMVSAEVEDVLVICR